MNLVGKLMGGKWVAAYHDFSLDIAISDVGDLSDEINLLYARGFGNYFSGDVKYADYSAGDIAFNKVDTQKTWFWVGYTF